MNYLNKTMKPFISCVLVILITTLVINTVSGQQNLTAKQIIEKADRNMQGESSISTMTMTINQRSLPWKPQ